VGWAELNHFKFPKPKGTFVWFWGGCSGGGVFENQKCQRELALRGWVPVRGSGSEHGGKGVEERTITNRRSQVGGDKIGISKV